MSDAAPTKVRGTCPRCGKAPPVRVSVRSSGPTVVTLNLRCDYCWRRGIETLFDVEIKAA